MVLGLRELTPMIGKHQNREESRLEDSDKDLKRSEALADLRRLTTVILDNLEEGSRDRLMDPKEMRLLGGTAIRSIRLYLKTLDEHHTRRTSGDQNDSSGKTKRTIEEDQTHAGKE